MINKLFSLVTAAVLFTLAIFFCSISYASFSNENIPLHEINYNGTQLEAVQDVFALFNYTWVQTDSTSANYQNSMIAALDTQPYFLIIHAKNINNGIFNIYTSSGPKITSNSTRTLFNRVPSGPYDYFYRFTAYNTSTSGYSITFNTNNYDYALYYDNGTWKEYSLDDKTIYSDSFDFDPNYDIIANYNSYQNVYTKKYDYSVQNWIMGDIVFSENYNRYEIQLLDTDGNVLQRGIYNKTLNTNTNYNIFITSSGNHLYVKSSYITFKKIYTLVIYPQDESGNISDNNFVGTFLYLPLNASFSGDVILSTGSGDYTTQNSSNDIVDSLTDTSEADSTLNNFFSGDTNDFANNLGYSPIENPFVSIISNTLQSMIDIILGSGNVDLDFSFGHQTYVVHSDDFTLPNGSIKTFVTLVSNGFLVWLIVKYGMMLYTWINSGRIQNIMNEVNGHWYRLLF